MSKKICCDDSGSIEVNNKSCGSSIQVESCRQVVLGCNCGCGGTSSCLRQVSQPYYRNVGMCPSDSKKTVIVERLVGAFRTAAAFSMPACGAKIWAFFDSVGDVPIGANMWAYGIGDLEITGFNPLTGEIELKNNCPEDLCAGQAQAAPGTPIPRCSVFVLSRPVCATALSGSTGNFPYLEVDFTAQGVDECINITVTNVNGISVGKNVAIKTGTYRVSAIVSATIITICNDGAGLTPDSPVIAKDSAGNHLVPIILIDVNPCTNEATTSGKLIVCDAGVERPLSGTENGQIPVLDVLTQTVNFRTIGIPILDCTELLACLTLDPELPSDTPYVITVQDTSDFEIYQMVIIGSEEFTISSITDDTHMYVVPLNPPDDIQTYLPGATVCSASCCVDLDARLTIIEHYVFDNLNPDDEAWLWCTRQTEDADPISETDIDAGDATIEGNTATLTLTNDSAVYTLRIMWAIEWHYLYDLYAVDGSVQEVGCFAEIAGPSTGSPSLAVQFDDPKTLFFQTVPGGTVGVNRHSANASFNGQYALLPGEVMTLKARSNMSFNAGDATKLRVKSLGARITAMGVAVRPG